MFRVFSHSFLDGQIGLGHILLLVRVGHWWDQRPGHIHFPKLGLFCLVNAVFAPFGRRSLGIHTGLFAVHPFDGDSGGEVELNLPTFGSMMRGFSGCFCQHAVGVGLFLLLSGVQVSPASFLFLPTSSRFRMGGFRCG